MTETTTLPVPGQALRASMEKCCSHGMTLFLHYLERKENGTASLIYGCQQCHVEEQDADHA